MGKLSRITWPQEYSELQRIEELLLCGICYDYMDTSVMTPCSHNYCSLCIRKYLHYKTQCPACFEKTFEKDLHTNRILDELICYFGKIRSKLVDCVAGAKIETAQDEGNIENSPKFTPVRPARTNQTQKKTPSKVEAKHNSVFSEKDATPEKIPSGSPSTSGLSKIATIFTPKSKKNATNVKTLPCPVCKVDVSEVNINKHLDDCLKRETTSQKPARTELKRKPLPKLVFSLMKDTELRKKIKEQGLPTQGDRKTLEARFQRYSTLYNAECDKIDPRPVEELLRQCDEEEALEKKMLKFSQAANRLKVNRNTEQNIIEEAQKKYLESNKKNYESLIQTIKERQKSQKPSAGRSPINEDIDDPSMNESSQKRISENNVNNSEDEDLDRTCYSLNAYDAILHDTDSDTSCPLQHYTSVDPISFLSIQMSSSDNASGNDFSTHSHSNATPDVKNSLDTTILPATNITLASGNDLPIPPTNKDLPIPPTNKDDDIFNATTDSESNDEVVPTAKVSKAAKPTTSHVRKRAKISVKKSPNADNAHQLRNNETKLEGKKLALSIARDFTFDTSSNESIGSGATHETVHTKPTEKPKAKARMQHEDIKLDLPNVDKENEDRCTTRSSTTSVSRPLRKRYCVTRSQNTRVDSSKDAGSSVANQTESSADQTENVPRVESPVKRRRRRKIETPAAPEPNNPPNRPLRKRNSVVKDNINQSS